MSATLAGMVGILALVLASAALVLSVLALRADVGRTPTVPEPQPAAAPAPREHAPGRSGDVGRLRGDIATLRLDLADALRHLAVVRYDAFGDMGGHLSWSMALLDDNGNGVVLTAINGRSDARSYAKNVREFVSDSKLSPEESEAIEYLRKEATGAE